MDMKNVKATQEWRPLTQIRLRSLLGLANYYHCFIRDFSKVARILSNLLEKWLSQEWNEPCYQDFGEPKSKLSSLPVLKFVDFDKLFEVHTGVSAKG